MGPYTNETVVTGQNSHGTEIVGIHFINKAIIVTMRGRSGRSNPLKCAFVRISPAQWTEKCNRDAEPHFGARRNFCLSAEWSIGDANCIQFGRIGGVMRRYLHLHCSCWPIGMFPFARIMNRYGMASQNNAVWVSTTANAISCRMHAY